MHFAVLVLVLRQSEPCPVPTNEAEALLFRAGSQAFSHAREFSRGQLEPKPGLLRVSHIPNMALARVETPRAWHHEAARVVLYYNS